MCGSWNIPCGRFNIICSRHIKLYYVILIFISYAVSSSLYALLFSLWWRWAFNIMLRTSSVIFGIFCNMWFFANNIICCTFVFIMMIKNHGVPFRLNEFSSKKEHNYHMYWHCTKGTLQVRIQIFFQNTQLKIIRMLR